MVEFSQPGAYNLAYFGKLSLNFSKHKIFEYINRGRALTFKVEFPLENDVPRVTSIKVNDIQICTGPKYGLPSTTVNLEYTLRTFPSSGSSSTSSSKYDTNPSRQSFWHPHFNQDPNLNKGAPEFLENPQSSLLDYFNEYRPAEEYVPRNVQPTFDSTTKIHYIVPTEPPTAATIKTNIVSGPLVTARPTERTIRESGHLNSSILEYIDSVCGQENHNFDIIKLNVQGTVIQKSRFPWISAVFRRVKGDFKFQCGGSLISTRTVVSAAHCFYLGFEVIKPDDILISMGLHDLTNWLDAHNVGVEKVIQHPDYKPTLMNFDADLAIVRLKQSVTFTTSIRPICMWQGSLDNSEIEGTSGIIVGWGADGHRNTTIVPTLVKANVVSEITCLRSNFVFISLTSNRTICAGNLDGSGPCMGDSGNGLMIKKQSKWMLRGTVSAALGTRTRQCILDQYAIYSDVAKFSEWLRSNMLL